MVDEQLVPRGIDDHRVLAAMRDVPRHEFVPTLTQRQAYADAAQPIGSAQTISQPFIVAWMAQLLELDRDDTVLEVGTGCGYAAAVLSRLCRSVVTVERHPSLGRAARRRLGRLGFDNVTVRLGDGSRGAPEDAPFAAVVVAAAARDVPPALVEKLRDGGRLVLPLGDESAQEMVRIRRDGRELLRDDLGGVRFVPLVIDVAR